MTVGIVHGVLLMVRLTVFEALSGRMGRGTRHARNAVCSFGVCVLQSKGFLFELTADA